MGNSCTVLDIFEKRKRNQTGRNKGMTVTTRRADPKPTNSLQRTLSVKSLDTPSHLMFFSYFHDYLHCTCSLKASKLWMNTYLCSEHKNFVSYFRFLKVAALCFVDSAANPLAFSRWASWCSHVKPEMVSLHRCALSGFICGISCLLYGVGTNSCVVQKSGWYTADSPIWQMLEFILWQEPIS